MKSARVISVMIGLAVTVLALAAPVSADTAVVPADDIFTVEAGQFFGGGPIVEGSDLSFTWNSDRSLTLNISGPSGVIASYPSSTSGSDTIDITATGTYYMIWTNHGAWDASLTYDYEVDPFAPAEDVIDAVVLGMIIVAIIVVVVIVLVVVVVIRGGKPKQIAQASQQAQPVPFTATNCPTCGAAIDGTSQWCARCGARLR